MRTLPSPLRDELLYSALARATYRYGFWSPKRLLDILYGSRSVVAAPDLPSNLAALVQVTASHWRIDVEKLATDHTLFGYYTYFRGARQRKQVLAFMARDGGSLQARLGICAGAARSPAWFRLCPACHSEDVAKFGEAYWHRAHHLPGVLACHLHGEPLLETAVSFRPHGRHAYLSAPVELNLRKMRPITDRLIRPDIAQAIAARSFELLVGTPVAAATKPDYRSRLSYLGVGWGRVHRLRSAFLDYFGEDLLQASFAREGAESLRWLDEVVRAPRRPLHPFKHVLMDVFLMGDGRVPQSSCGTAAARTERRWRVYRNPEMRRDAASLALRGLTINAVARALDVDWKTANRLLAPLPPSQAAPSRNPQTDRHAWEALAAARPELGKKGLRTAAPALYTRLYRYDRAWLLSWRSERAHVPPKGRRRIDWTRRDVELEALVRGQIIKTLKAVPMRRASKNRVLVLLGIRALVAHRGELLPRTTAALEEMCETVESFQLRRLVSVFSQERTGRLPDWKVLRAAHINPDRFPDGGSGLLRQARRQVKESHAIKSHAGSTR